MNISLTIKNAINKFRKKNFNAAEADIAIPDWLKPRKINEYDVEVLVDFFKYSKIKTFGEINVDLINAYGKINYEQVIKLCGLLGLYGIVFTGQNKSKYSPGDTETPCIIEASELKRSIYHLDFTNLNIDKIKNKENEFKILDFLNKKDISIVTQLNGINLSVLASLINIESEEIKAHFNNAGFKLMSTNQSIDLYEPKMTKELPTLNPQDIDSGHADVLIEHLGLSTRTYNILKRENIKTLNDLSTLTEHDILSFKNAGQGTLKDVRKIIDLKQESLPSPQRNSQEYIEEIVTVELNDNHFLTFDSSSLSERAMWALSLLKIKNVGQLLEVFPDEFHLNDEFCSCHDLFEIELELKNYLYSLGFDKYPISYTKNQKEMIDAPTLKHIIEEGFTSILIKEITKELDEYQSQLKDTKLATYNGRVRTLKKQTLEELGQKNGVTRERIRQIEKKIRKEIAPIFYNKMNNFNLCFNKINKAYGGIYYNETTECPRDYMDLLNHFINQAEGFNFIIDFDKSLIYSSDVCLEQVKDNILNDLQDIDSEIISQEQIKNILATAISSIIHNDNEENRNNFNKAEEMIFSKILKKEFIRIDSNTFKLKSKNHNKRTSARDEKILHYFEKLYPNGVHLPINNDEKLENELKELIEVVPELKSSCVRGIIDRTIKQSNKIIMWDRGFYIHINHVSVDLNILNKSIIKIFDYFNQGISQFKIDKLFKDDKEYYTNAGIPNSYALLGLLKYKEPKGIKFKKYEIFNPQEQEDKRDKLEIFDEFIKDRNDFVSKEELLDYFCTDRGWQDYQLESLLGRSQNVIKSENNYIHYENIKYNLDNLRKLAGYISKEVDSVGAIKLHKIKDKYYPTWYSVCNNDVSDKFISELLCKQENLSFTIERKIYAVPLCETNNNLDKEVNFKNLLRNFIYEESKSNHRVGMDDITRFREEKGSKSWLSAGAIRNLGMLEYFEGQFVHPDIVGYSDEMLEELTNIAQEAANKCYEDKIAHVEFDLIFSMFEQELPTLNSGYEWTEKLLGSILSKVKFIEVFSKSFIFIENPFNVEDMDDIAAYILANEFPNEAICKTSKLEKLLKRDGIIGNNESINTHKRQLFADGSSIELVDDGNNIRLSKIGRERYLNA